MHGIIHKALKDMVTAQFGAARWKKIEDASKNPNDIYIGMQGYSDDITYSLIGSATKELGVSVEDCLERFGEYWVLEAAPSTYSDILDSTSDELIGFIQRLNSLHDRIISTFPHYIPPEFYIESIGNDLYEVRYVSVRKGLCHFVIGLFNGLAKRFNRVLEIQNIEQLVAESGEEWLYTIRVPSK